MKRKVTKCSKAKHKIKGIHYEPNKENKRGKYDESYTKDKMKEGKLVSAGNKKGKDEDEIKSDKESRNERTEKTKKEMDVIEGTLCKRNTEKTNKQTEGKIRSKKEKDLNKTVVLKMKETKENKKE